MTIEIKEVKTESELKQFVEFPFKLYKGHQHWIPPIKRAEMATLTPEKNPVFEHSEAIVFTAWKNGKLVGRIVGMINQIELDFIKKKHARFGWIDFIDDKNVSKALIEAVEKWAKQKGMDLLKGPYGFNQLDKNGMLTEGFDSTGTVNTIYNYEYYPKHIEALGYEKELEWVEYWMRLAKEIPPKIAKISSLVRKRYKLTTIQPKTTQEMIERGDQLFDLLMETYQDLPGFVPISDNQRKSYINRYIKFLRKDLVVIVADENDEPIAFGVTMPSMTKAYKKAKGNLFPFGILHMLAARKWNDTADLALIGVKEEWRKKGAHGLVFNDSIAALLPTKIYNIKINPMLEFNTNVLSLWKEFEHGEYKRRRTYQKKLT